MVVTHVPFTILISLVIWTAVDQKGVWEAHYGELVTLFFMHISRLLAIAVKYSHVDRETLTSYLLHNNYNEAIKANWGSYAAHGMVRQHTNSGCKLKK